MAIQLRTGAKEPSFESGTSAETSEARATRSVATSTPTGIALSSSSIRTSKFRDPPGRQIARGQPLHMQVYPGACVMQKEPEAELASVLLGVVKARPDQVAGHPQDVL